MENEIEQLRHALLVAAGRFEHCAAMIQENASAAQRSEYVSRTMQFSADARKILNTSTS